MRTYTDRLSHRTGCPCCTTRHGAGYRPTHGHKAPTRIAAIRAGKKAARRANKAAITESASSY